MNMEFARKLTALRKQKQLSIEELAQKLDVSAEELLLCEQGDTAPNLEIVEKAALFFGVDKEFFDVCFEKESDNENSEIISQQSAAANALSKTFLLTAFLTLVFRSSFSTDLTGIRNVFMIIFLLCAMIAKFVATKKRNEPSLEKSSKIPDYMGYVLCLISLLPMLLGRFSDIGKNAKTVALLLFLILFQIGAFLIFKLHEPKTIQKKPIAIKVLKIFLWIAAFVLYGRSALYMQQGDFAWLILLAVWLLT